MKIWSSHISQYTITTNKPSSIDTTHTQINSTCIYNYFNRITQLHLNCTHKLVLNQMRTNCMCGTYPQHKILVVKDHLGSGSLTNLIKRWITEICPLTCLLLPQPFHTWKSAIFSEKFMHIFTRFDRHDNTGWFDKFEGFTSSMIFFIRQHRVMMPNPIYIHI